MPRAASDRKQTVVQMIDGLGRGGAEALLTAYASEIERQGFDVRVVVLQNRDGNPEADRLRANGISVELLPLDKLRRIDQIRAALRRLRRMKPDIIHAHLEASTLLAGIARIVLRVPVVSTLHTLEYPERLDRASARLWVRNRVLANIYDRVICLSSAIEANARGHGLSRAPLISISNGIDIARFDRDVGHAPEVIRAGLGIPDGSRLVISVAVLRQPKGIDRLIRAVARVRETVPDLHLLIVGDGEEKSRLETLAHDLGVSDSVTFSGFRNDVPDLLRAADLFALPTLWDALPTVLIEAMAAHLPIVASDVGGIPDMVRSETEGLLVPVDDVDALADAISRIMGDDGLRARMASAARQRAEAEFSLPTQIGKLTALYRQLIKGQR